MSPQEAMAKAGYDSGAWKHKQPWDKNPWAQAAWQECAGDMLKALTAAGFAIVPVEPTKTMMDAGLYQASADAEYGDVHSIWKDMVRVAGN